MAKLVQNTPILESLKEVHILQEQAFDDNATDSEEYMQKIFKQRQKYFHDVLLHIKNDPYSQGFIVKSEFQERTLFLRNRMALNLKRGNPFAIKRDKIALAYMQQLDYLNQYTLGLATQLQAYATQKEIKAYASITQKKHKNVNKEKFTKTYQSIVNDQNPVAQALRANFKAYISISESLDGLIIFTYENPELLAQKTIFTLVNYDDIIRSVNARPSALWLNQKISFLYLNTGKLVALIVITLLLGLSLYLMKWILRFSFFNFKHYENRKLLRPIRLLLAVTALDYFILMLMYPLPPKDSIESVLLLAYVMASAYLFMEMFAYVVVGYFETHESNQNQKALTSLSIDLLKMLIVLVALIIYLNKMGVSLQTVLTTVGIFGLGIALAAKDSMANFFGSLNILLDNAFTQGDVIRIGDIEGEVVKVGLRSTQIRGFDNALIVLPNAEVSVKPIINWSKRRLGREIKTSVSLSYSIPPQKLRDLLEDIRYMVAQHPDLVNSEDIERFERESKEEIFVSKRKLLGLRQEKFVYLDSFDPSHLTVLVQTFSLTTQREEWYKVKEDVLYAILEILNKHEVNFALPGQDLFLKNSKQDTKK